MRFLQLLSALSLGSLAVADLSPDIPAHPDRSCTADPTVNALLSNCDTATAFCSSYIGRGPSTTTVTHITKTTTTPSTVTDYKTKITTTSIQTVFTTTVMTTVTDSFNATTYTTSFTSCSSMMKRDSGVNWEPHPSCGVANRDSVDISAGCSCLLDKRAFSTTTTTITAPTPTSRITTSAATISSFSTDTTSTITTSTTSTITMTVPVPSEIDARVSGEGAAYYNFFAGGGVTEDPSNPGNNPMYPPYVTELTVTDPNDVCDAVSQCVDIALSASRFSVDLHYLISEGNWECVQYYDGQLSGEYFNQSNSDVSFALGFAAD